MGFLSLVLPGLTAATPPSGHLWAVGSNTFGQLGDGWKYGTAKPLAGGVGAFSVGANQIFFVKQDGTLWGVGDSFAGQLGESTLQFKTVPVQITSGVSAVATGPRCELILKTDGTLWVAGENKYGQLGDGTTANRTTPVQVASGVSSMSAGYFHNLFVKTDGTLWGMGLDGNGALQSAQGYPNSLIPMPVIQQWNDPLLKVSSAAAGFGCTFIVTNDGTLWAMGNNASAQLGDGTTTSRIFMIKVDTGVASVAAGTSHTLYVKTDGTLWGMGSNADGQLGIGSGPAMASQPVQIASGVRKAAAANRHSLFLKTDGTLWGMGYNYEGELGDGTTTQRFTPVQVADGVTDVSAAGVQSAYRTADGTLWVTGANGSGQLGENPSPYRPSPVLMGTDAITAVGGQYYSLLLKGDGTLWGAGSNDHGQLGLDHNRAPAIHSTLELIADDVGAVTAGQSFSLFIKTDQSLWAIGGNVVGQLGDGTTVDRDTPVQVTTGVTAVGAGSAHGLYIKSDQTLWAMGYNNSGQLGDGTTTNRSTPVQVATGVSAVAAGDQHSLFLKSDGTLWGMGLNSSGQLGDGTTAAHNTPVLVASDVKAVAASFSSTLFVKTDGTLWATGANEAGLFGDGTTTGRLSPMQVATGVSAIACGRYHSLRLKTDGTVWAAGYNVYGQLGDGTSTDRSTPVKIASDALAVAAGVFTSFFIQQPGAGTVPVVTTQPVDTRYTISSPVALSVTATGTTPIDYVWLRNGVAIPGARSATYIVPSAQADTQGSYQAVVTNAAGTVTSTSVALSQLGKAYAQINLSNYIRYADGNPKYVVVGTVPEGLPVKVTYRGANGLTQAPTEAGSYEVSVVIDDVAYQGTAAVTLLISKIDQHITIQSPASYTYGDAPAYVGGSYVDASATSGLPLTLTVVSGPAKVVDGIVTVTGAGTVTLHASQAGDARFNAAADVEYSFLVKQASQVIGFASIWDTTVTHEPFTIDAAANLPVTFSVVSGPATVSGVTTRAVGQAVFTSATVTVTGVGPVTIRASQAGDANYAPATDVEQSFTVAKTDQTITFFQRNRTYGAPFKVAGTSDSGLPVTITVLAGPATVTDGVLSLTGTGEVILRASQPGNENFNAANVDCAFTVYKAQLVITADSKTRGYGMANPAFTLTYDGFVNGDTAASITPPTAGTLADATYPAGEYPIVLTGGAAGNYALTLVNGTLTVTPHDWSGSYFGTFATGGHWALQVRADRTATYLAYLPSRGSAIVVNLTIDPSGSFYVASSEIKPSAAASVRSLALATPESPVVRKTAAVDTFGILGQIGVDGAITGQIPGLDVTFSGAADATGGPAQASAGLYTASTLGTTAGTAYAIVGTSGQTFVLTTGASVDSAGGTLNGSGQLTTTTTSGSALSLNIDSNARSLAASVTPAGSSTPIVYNGIAATVTPVARVVNLSVRSQAGTGSQTLIVGAVINGGSKTLLLRGAGPALIPHGVTNALADPAMRLLDGPGAQLDTNDNWDNSLLAKFTELGASPFAPNSKDAALYKQLGAGAYSVHVYPANTGTGVVLAELYDADTVSTGAEVVNVSARTQVGTDDNILILGFVITGNTPKTFLIRGMGPTLIPLGVTDGLVDPQLYLYEGNAVIGSNDNWGGAAALKTAASTLGATPFLSDTSKDAAMLVTLAPGSYTAQVSGVNRTTGVGLVEIYLMP